MQQPVSRGAVHPVPTDVGDQRRGRASIDESVEVSKCLDRDDPFERVAALAAEHDRAPDLAVVHAVAVQGAHLPDAQRHLPEQDHEHVLAGPGLDRRIQQVDRVQGGQPGAPLLALVDLGSGHVLGGVTVGDLVDDGVLVEQVHHAELRRPGGRRQVLVLEGPVYPPEGNGGSPAI